MTLKTQQDEKELSLEDEKVVSRNTPNECAEIIRIATTIFKENPKLERISFSKKMNHLYFDSSTPTREFRLSTRISRVRPEYTNEEEYEITFLISKNSKFPSLQKTRHEILRDAQKISQFINNINNLLDVELSSFRIVSLILEEPNYFCFQESIIESIKKGRNYEGLIQNRPDALQISYVIE